MLRPMKRFQGWRCNLPIIQMQIMLEAIEKGKIIKENNVK
jgi:hypothetical protein